MITTRDIKVFIFSIFITTLCLALFNNNPIKEAEAQGPGGPPAAPCVGHEECAGDAHRRIANMVRNQFGFKGEEHAIIINKLDTELAIIINKLDTLLAR